MGLSTFFLPRKELLFCGRKNLNLAYILAKALYFNGAKPSYVIHILLQSVNTAGNDTEIEGISKYMIKDIV